MAFFIPRYASGPRELMTLNYSILREVLDGFRGYPQTVAMQNQRKCEITFDALLKSDVITI